MALSGPKKIHYLEKAIEIAKAAAGSGGSHCTEPRYISEMIEKTYKKMVEIAEGVRTDIDV